MKLSPLPLAARITGEQMGLQRMKSYIKELTKEAKRLEELVKKAAMVS